MLGLLPDHPGAVVEIRAPGSSKTVPLSQLEKAPEGYGVKVPIRWSLES